MIETRMTERENEHEKKMTNKKMIEFEEQVNK